MKKNHYHAALSQIKNIPVAIWQECVNCHQNFNTNEMTFVLNECEHCRAKQQRSFTYISEDDGQEHEAHSSRIDWDAILEPSTREEPEYDAPHCPQCGHLYAYGNVSHPCDECKAKNRQCVLAPALSGVIA